MSGKPKIILSVLLLICGTAALFAGVLFWTAGADILPGSSYKEPWCVVELQKVTKLGRTYGTVQAEEGYSFYELSYRVFNTGDGEAYRQLPDMYYESAEYDDVYDEDTWDRSWEFQDTETPLFEGYYDACIPPGRSVQASEVLMIKDGTRSLRATYYPGYSDEELTVEIALLGRDN